MVDNLVTNLVDNIKNLMLINSNNWLAQVIVQPGINSPQDAAALFSGPKFFVALVAGVLLAFAFQFVLTNLSVAAGISYLGHQSDDEHDEHGNKNLGQTIRKISFTVGLWTLITVSIALFLACFLAVKLSLLFSPTLGAIVGLVIWAAYFSLLVWLSSATVGSLIGSVVNTVTSGFQTMVNTATAALGTKVASDRIVATAGASAAAFRRELTSAINPDSLRDTLEDYLETLRPPELDTQKIRREFENLLQEPEFQSLASSDSLKKIDRQQFVDLIKSRTDLSPREVNRLADELEASWKKVTRGQKQQTDMVTELRNYFASALPEKLRSNELTSKLEQLFATQKTNNSHNQDESLVDKAKQFALTSLMGIVLGRQDLSDIDVEEILRKFRTIKDKVGSQAGKLSEQISGNNDSTVSIIRSDVENFLLNSYPWEISSDNLERNFQEVIYDTNANPQTVRQELQSLNRNFFVELLNQRQAVFTQAKIGEIADRLENIRLDTISKLKSLEIQEQTKELYTRLANYLKTANQTTLLSENLQYDLADLLNNDDADPEILQAALKKLDVSAFRQIISQRQDGLIPNNVEQIINQLFLGRQRALSKTEERLASEKSALQGLQGRIESYLRNTDKAALNPEGIKRDLQTVFQDPQLGLINLRYRFSHLDRDTLVKLLSERRDLSKQQVNQTLNQIESTWDSLTHAPQALAGKAKEQYDEFTTRLADYLRNTNLEELNPEGIGRDLTQLLNDPKTGTLALRRRLSQVDRETLVKLLSQRQDLSEEQVNRTLDQIQSGIRQVVKAPRRLATRTQAKIQDFQFNLENYLSNTDKDELNPEGIKRDLQLLVQDPRVGLESLSERLAKFDRSTIVALLAQRPDISEAEANRIVDEIENARNQFVEQVRNIERRIQSVIDGIFAQIRKYLNSLERPELNYDGIRLDIRKLFADPQAGFEALRARLSQFNRDTLVAILSSRDDISEADANRIIDQIENARNSALQRAERIQQAAQNQLQEIKHQAKMSAAETRKAAEIASWWLFGTALTSALVSAIAGAIAVNVPG